MLVLGAQLGEHLVALGDRDESAETGGGKPGELGGAATKLTRRRVRTHDSTL